MSGPITVTTGRVIRALRPSPTAPTPTSKDGWDAAPRDEIDAILIGPFAVFETTVFVPEVPEDKASWTVSHRATGGAILQRAPDRLAALGAALELLLLLPDEWDFADPTQPQRMSPDVRATIRRVIVRAQVESLYDTGND